MICSVCGCLIDRIDHLVFIDGCPCCAPTIEAEWGSVAYYLEVLAEETEVYGG